MFLILASSSPRRRFLLKQAGFSPRIMTPDIDETVKRGESPRLLVKRLSKEKALAVSHRLKRTDFVIIAADTIVVLDDKILGKPESETHAFKMLKSLSGKQHQVFTGYAILAASEGGLWVRQRVVKTSVSFRKLSNSIIRRYIDTKEPFDKAGGYGAQGGAMGFIESIRGSYTNVIGLPLSEVLEDLEALTDL